MVRLGEDQVTPDRVTLTLCQCLPKEPRMTPAEKDFWLEVSRLLTPDELGQLAKVVAFMRKVEGF